MSIFIYLCTHIQYSIRSTFAEHNYFVSCFVNRCLLLILWIERNLEFYYVSTEILHDYWVVFALFIQWNCIVWLQLFHNSWFCCRPSSLKLFLGLPITINWNISFTEFHLNFINNFDILYCRSTAQRANLHNSLECIIWFEGFVSNIVCICIQFIHHWLNLVLHVDSHNSHSVLRECTCLVTTDATCGPQCFYTLKCFDQHILGRHAFSDDCKRYSDTEQQSLRYIGYNQSNELNQISNHISSACPANEKEHKCKYNC